jgi:hypothetical protein
MTDGTPTESSGRGAAAPAGREAVRGVLREAIDRQADGVDTVRTLRGAAADAADPGGELAWLAAYDLDKSVSDLAGGALHALAFEKDALPAGEAKRARKSSRTALLKALRDMRVPDSRKLALAPLYEWLGGKLSTAEYRAFFRDFETAARGRARSAAAAVRDDPRSIEDALGAAGLMPAQPSVSARDAVEGLVRLSMDMRASSPAAAAALLGATAAAMLERSRPEEELAGVLETLAGNRCPRAAWCLDELGRWPAAGAVGARAGELAAGLRSGGLLPGLPPQPEFARAHATGVDGNGSRSLAVFFRSTGAACDALMLLPNDSVGVKDIWIARPAGSRIEAALRKMGEDVAIAPCGIDLARELLADALAIHGEIGRPPPGLLYAYRPLFGAEPIAPRRRRPDPREFMADLGPLPPSPSDEEAGEVLEYPAYRTLWFSSKEVYDMVSWAMKSASGPGPERTARQLAESVFPQERERLLSRLAVNLEVEALAGRGREKVNRLAARAWLDLAESSRPALEMPFVMELCRQTWNIVAVNITMDYRSQEEANAARERMDEEAPTTRGSSHDTVAGR